MAYTDTDIAWLAGIIDGEGCLSLTRMGNGEAYQLRFFLDNSSLPMIEKASRLLTELGADVHRHSPRLGARGPLSKLQLHRIYVAKGLNSVLIAVLPYMVTEKREFAEACINLASLRPKAYALWTEEQRMIAREIRNRFMPHKIRD